MTEPRRIYLDYNATAPLRPEARAAMCAAIEVFGNPSSVHAEGRAARALIETARHAVGRLIGGDARGLTFTSSATEALNTVIAGGWGRVIVAASEHAAVLAPAARTGRAEYVRVDGDGRIVLDDLARLLGPEEGSETGRRVAGGTLVCVQAANNETGVIQPIQSVSALCRERGAFLLCDAVQAAGKVPFDCHQLGIDYAVVSAHKIGGPKGVGALWTGQGAGVPPLIVGGGQEHGLRGGTQNVAGIAAFGAAADAARAELQTALDRTGVKADFEARIKASVPDCVIVGETVDRLPQTVCVVMPGRSAETLVIALDLAGIAVSSGAACSSGKVSKSHVLAAMGFDDQSAASAVRISWGWLTQPEELRRCTYVLARSAGRPSQIERVA